MTEGFTKLYSSIVFSTIWREDDKTRLVWITMLAIADENGDVKSSIPGLADAARVSISECEAALQKLSSPDKYSRSKEQEGRRIVEIDGGWNIVNRNKYRDKTSNRTEYWREYKRKKRGTPSTVDNVDNVESPPISTQEEAKEEVKEENNKKEHCNPIAKNTIPADGFVAYWNQFSSLPGIQNMNATRIKQLKTRVKEETFAENWKAIIEKLSQSKFHTGENDRGWKANVDWILKNDTNYMKILEMPDVKSQTDKALGRGGKSLADVEQLERACGLS
jgi:hypothetical protein